MCFLRKDCSISALQFDRSRWKCISPGFPENITALVWRRWTNLVSKESKHTRLINLYSYLFLLVVKRGWQRWIWWRMLQGMKMQSNGFICQKMRYNSDKTFFSSFTLALRHSSVIRMMMGAGKHSGHYRWCLPFGFLYEKSVVTNKIICLLINNWNIYKYLQNFTFETLLEFKTWLVLTLKFQRKSLSKKFNPEKCYLQVHMWKCINFPLKFPFFNYYFR